MSFFLEVYFVLRLDLLHDMRCGNELANAEHERAAAPTSQIGHASAHIAVAVCENVNVVSVHNRGLRNRGKKAVILTQSLVRAAPV